MNKIKRFFNNLTIQNVLYILGFFVLVGLLPSRYTGISFHSIKINVLYGLIILLLVFLYCSFSLYHFRMKAHRKDNAIPVYAHQYESHIKLITQPYEKVKQIELKKSFKDGLGLAICLGIIICVFSFVPKYYLNLISNCLFIILVFMWLLHDLKNDTKPTDVHLEHEDYVTLINSGDVKLSNKKHHKIFK